MPFQVSVQIPEPMIQNLNGREANLERTPPEANKQQSDPSYPELLASKTAEIRTKISRPEQASPDYAGTIAKADEGDLSFTEEILPSHQRRSALALCLNMDRIGFNGTFDRTLFRV
jgi:hypothetical protein